MRRRVNPADRRSFTIELTAAGARAAARVHAAFAALDERVLADVPRVGRRRAFTTCSTRSSARRRAAMTDETFLSRFEAASLTSFDHRDHLRVAFAYARRGGVEHAVARAREGLRRFAAAHGEPGRYHDTLTTAWARVVGHYALLARDDDFDAFLAAHPRLVDRDLLSAHYSRERLFSAAARAGFVEPDLLALPWKRVTDGARIVVPGKDAGVGAVRTHCPTQDAARRDEAPASVTRRPWRGG